MSNDAETQPRPALMAERKAKNQDGADRLTVTLAPGQRKMLETIARENHVSLAFVARRMLSDFIHAHRNKRLRLSFAETPRKSEA
ncbi:MAG: hypothetical protein HYS41_04770 [Candidatus Omnitrophica bacterium]|nr:hypothetical protein [Candidatus Omnitrophota bacterium]